MFQKFEGYMHTQIALDFKLNLDVIARKDALQKIYAMYQKIYDSHTLYIL